MTPAKKSKGMSAEHKAALAEGRAQGRAVRLYLDALDAHKPKRGRRRTPESIKARLARIDYEINNVDSVRRVDLIQERINLQQELESHGRRVDIADLEKGFIENAAAYSKRKSISYAAWREAGVPASTLKAAGISRAGG